tara:strand:- start:45856 stop:47664 length:1809 start_codon:yes stop_codon:yes gene_type:complete
MRSKKIELNYGLMLLFCFSTFFLFAQTEVIPIWPNGIPGSISNAEYIEEATYDASNNLNGLSKISEPDLTIFLADSTLINGTSVIICPGGGYTHLAINKEGYKIAQWLNTLGVSAFVLKYRMPTDETMEDKSIGPLQDAQEAIRIVRRNAEKWNLNPNKIGFMGFSAGGHLASTLATHYTDKVYSSNDEINARPDFSILIYPVISMEDGVTHQGSKSNLLGKNPSQELIETYSNAKQVNTKTPPTFLVHATDDGAVPVENSLEYYLALKKNHVPVEMHIYENGGHGFGLGKNGTNSNWSKACENWLIMNNYIPEKSIYMFSYFKDNGEDGLHLAYSEDGYSWNALKNDTSFLIPKVGKDKLMRDPCIIKGGDGNYHMVWTVSWTDKGIGYASSKDLINWSEQQFIPVMEYEKGTRNTWAPEITYDENSEVYMIYWASTIEGKFKETKSNTENGYNHRIYFTTTKNFKTFTPTKLLYEPGFNVIDATVQKVDGTFIMFLKDETREPAQKNIKIAYSTNLTGPYAKASAPITGNYWAEGPTVLKINKNWITYFDKYRDHKYGAVTSTDLKNWTDISEKINFPEGTRHGSIFSIPMSLFLQLQRQ